MKTPVIQHFRSVSDVPDIGHLLDLAEAYKRAPRVDSTLGTGKTLGLVFLNPSTRTRISTQIAARNLGMEVVVFNANQDGWTLEFDDDAVMNGTSVEHIREAAPVLGQYCDILAVRSFPALVDKTGDRREKILNQFVEHSGRPVVSLESATLHPLQSLADLLTIRELWREKRRPRIALVWAPHIKALPHCVANSFAQWVNAWGEADLVVAQPEGYQLDPEFTGNAEITTDLDAALGGADFVYVKNWSATNPYGQAICQDASWMLTLQKWRLTNSARVMHCLPVRRNVELDGNLLDSPASAVIQQAGNRVWSAQAVLGSILKTL